MKDVSSWWFTNIDNKKRSLPLDLYKRYSAEEYPHYDNYDAIEVSKTCEIPMDYDGVMGVPISFLAKYCPEQFEIVGIDRYVEDNPHYGHRFKIKFHRGGHPSAPPSPRIGTARSPPLAFHQRIMIYYYPLRRTRANTDPREATPERKNEMNTNTTTTTNPDRARTFAIYHPNAKGTGCAVKMEIFAATESRTGYIRMDFARQMAIGDRGATPPTFPTFDWDNAIRTKIGFSELSKIMQVIRGETESIYEGKGFYFRREDGRQQRICFRHILEPVMGYSLEVYENNPTIGTDADCVSHILLYPDEALGLSMAFESVMGIICFGIGARTADEDPVQD